MLSKTLKLIAEIDRKFAWSFIGVLLAIYFGVSALPKTSLRYEIISNSRVIDVHETLGKLECFYDKWSLKENNEELRLITLRVVNNGNKTILTSFYDDNDPLGLVISSGHLIEKPELITQLTESEYLLKNLKVVLTDERTVKFSKVILEPNEPFGISLLVKVQAGLNTTISPIGKVAEIRNIEVRDIFKEAKQPYLYNILTKAIEGDPNVQLFRVIIYNSGLLITFTLFSVISIFVYDIYIILTRKKLIKEFNRLLILSPLQAALVG